MGPGGFLRPADDLPRWRSARLREHLQLLRRRTVESRAVERGRRRLGRHRFRLGHLAVLPRATSFKPWFDYWLRGQGERAPGRSDQASKPAPTNGGSTRPGRPNRASTRRLYFREARRAVVRSRPPTASEPYDEYVSDPANPVPYRPRPVPPTYPGPEWPVWLVQDQRFVDHRPDVLSLADRAATGDVAHGRRHRRRTVRFHSGTDSDWVGEADRRLPRGRA